MNREQIIRLHDKLSSKFISSIKEKQKKGTYPKSFSMPIGLQFELTSKCNLKCKHCYNMSGDIKIRDELKPNDWIEFAKDIIKLGGIFQCIISGGEPLLFGNELFNLMDLLHNDGTAFILITNGMLVNYNIVNRLQKYRFFWVQVSIDDVDEKKHDIFRGVKGSWHRAINAAFLLSAAGLSLRIAHTITPDNLSRLEDMIELAYQLGASSIVCSYALPSGRANLSESFFQFNNDDFLGKVYTTVEKCRKKFNNKILVMHGSDVIIDSKRKVNTPNTSAIIRPNGDVRMDCTMPFILGNIKEKSFKDIWLQHGISCWRHPAVNDYLSKLDKYGIHPEHRNHVDQDYILT